MDEDPEKVDSESVNDTIIALKGSSQTLNDTETKEKVEEPLWLAKLRNQILTERSFQEHKNNIQFDVGSSTGFDGSYLHPHRLSRIVTSSQDTSASSIKISTDIINDDIDDHDNDDEISQRVRYTDCADNGQVVGGPDTKDTEPLLECSGLYDDDTINGDGEVPTACLAWWGVRVDPYLIEEIEARRARRRLSLLADDGCDDSDEGGDLGAREGVEGDRNGENGQRFGLGNGQDSVSYFEPNATASAASIAQVQGADSSRAAYTWTGTGSQGALDPHIYPQSGPGPQRWRNSNNSYVENSAHNSGAGPDNWRFGNWAQQAPQGQSLGPDQSTAHWAGSGYSSKGPDAGPETRSTLDAMDSVPDHKPFEGYSRSYQQDAGPGMGPGATEYGRGRGQWRDGREDYEYGSASTTGPGPQRASVSGPSNSGGPGPGVPPPQTRYFYIPDQAVSGIIGKAGSVIADLRRQFHVGIYIDKDDLKLPSEDVDSATFYGGAPVWGSGVFVRRVRVVGADDIALRGCQDRVVDLAEGIQESLRKRERERHLHGTRPTTQPQSQPQYAHAHSQAHMSQAQYGVAVDVAAGDCLGPVDFSSGGGAGVLPGVAGVKRGRSERERESGGYSTWDGAPRHGSYRSTGLGRGQGYQQYDYDYQYRYHQEPQQQQHQQFQHHPHQQSQQQSDLSRDQQYPSATASYSYDYSHDHDPHRLATYNGLARHGHGSGSMDARGNGNINSGSNAAGGGGGGGSHWS